LTGTQTVFIPSPLALSTRRITTRSTRRRVRLSWRLLTRAAADLPMERS
jgi:hypothetical protein